MIPSRPSDNNLLYNSRPILHKHVHHLGKTFCIRTSSLAKQLKCSLSSALYCIKSWQRKGWATVSKVTQGWLVTVVIHRHTANHPSSIIKPTQYNKRSIRKKHCRMNNYIDALSYLRRKNVSDDMSEWFLRMIVIGRAKYFKHLDKILSGMEFYKASNKGLIAGLVDKLTFRSKNTYMPTSRNPNRVLRKQENLERMARYRYRNVENPQDYTQPEQIKQKEQPKCNWEELIATLKAR